MRKERRLRWEREKGRRGGDNEEGRREGRKEWERGSEKVHYLLLSLTLNLSSSTDKRDTQSRLVLLLPKGKLFKPAYFTSRLHSLRFLPNITQSSFLTERFPTQTQSIRAEMERQGNRIIPSTTPSLSHGQFVKATLFPRFFPPQTRPTHPSFEPQK